MYVIWNPCGGDTGAFFRIINRAANQERDFANSDPEMMMIKGDDSADSDNEVVP